MTYVLPLAFGIFIGYLSVGWFRATLLVVGFSVAKEVLYVLDHMLHITSQKYYAFSATQSSGYVLLGIICGLVGLFAGRTVKSNAS